MAKLRTRQAVSAAIRDEMRRDPSVLMFGEDVGDAAGVFKTSEGLLEEFGPLRVRDTPISEMGFLGAAVGAAATGLRPVVEIMFVEFLGVALDQLVTEAAKFHYLSGGGYKVPLVIRASAGGRGLTLDEIRRVFADDPVVILEPRYERRGLGDDASSNRQPALRRVT